MTIGKPTVVTNAMEAIRYGVQQETADELVGIERHPLLAAACSVILPSECDAIVVHADEAGIGDGDAMGVAAEIGQHLFGSGKWRLGIDHPVDMTRRFKGSIEGDRTDQTGDVTEELKLPPVVGRAQLFEKQPPEQPRQNPHGQKEVRPKGDPSGLVGRQSAAWYDAVDMRVILQVLAPGVQYRNEANLCAEMPGIGGKPAQRLGDGAKQDSIGNPPGN